jgi:hypothetical protein
MKSPDTDVLVLLLHYFPKMKNTSELWFKQRAFNIDFFPIPKKEEVVSHPVRVITVFTVFRLLTDFVCLYTYEF